MRYLAYGLLLVAVVSPSVRAADIDRTKANLRESFDLRYYPGKDRQTLDVFAPRTGTSLPVVVFVHGGTWMVGDKNFFGINRGVGRFLASRGVVTIVINYRLSPVVRHPEHVKDVARALTWAIRHAPEYGGDPSRIILAGHSAGAHLVTLLATDPSYLADPALKLDETARKAVRGVVALSGVYRIPAPDEFAGMARQIVATMSGDSPAGKMFGTALFGMRQMLNPFPLVFGSDPDIQTKASPINHVRKSLPPFLLLYAEKEVPGLTRMAEDFAAALRKDANLVELKRIDACTHRSIVQNLHNDDNEAARSVLAFIERTTRPVGKP